MGVKNAKIFWLTAPKFQETDPTITLSDKPKEKFKIKRQTWISYNGRTIAFIPSHLRGDPNSKSVLYVNTIIGYPGKTFAPIEVTVGESFTLWDVQVTLTKAGKTSESYHYGLKKATKSAHVDLKFDQKLVFNFETVMKYNHEGADFYITLGSIGNKHVDFFIWNSSLEMIESSSFRTSKWCKVGDFVFNVPESTKDTATIFVKKQVIRDVASTGAITLAFDEIIRIKDNDNLVTMQAVKMGPLHPGYFDMWCTLDKAGQTPVTGYLQDMRERHTQQFAIAYSLQCTSIEHPANSAPRYNLTVTAIDCPVVDFNEEFTLMKGKSVVVKGMDLKIRFDRSSHKHKMRDAGGGIAVGFFHLTTIVGEKEEEKRYSIKGDGTAVFKEGSWEGKLISTVYDQSVTLILPKVAATNKSDPPPF